MHEPTGWCEGCGRTIEEIAAWGSLDDAGRERIRALLPARRAELQRVLFPDAAPAASR
jgi:hypothetical protein